MGLVIFNEVSCGLPLHIVLDAGLLGHSSMCTMTTGM